MEVAEDFEDQDESVAGSAVSLVIELFNNHRFLNSRVSPRQPSFLASELIDVQKVAKNQALLRQ